MVQDARLMIVVPSLETGGTERQVVLLIHGLVKIDAGWLDRLKVVVMRRSGSLETELPPGTLVEHLGTDKFYDPRAAFRLRRAVVSWRPAVVYSLLAPANIATALGTIGLGRKVVWGHRSQTLSTGHGRLRRGITTALLKLLSPRVRRVIVNSEAAGAFTREIGTLAKRTTIVPNAVDGSRFRPPEATMSEARVALGMPPDDRVVLTVGRLADDKDHVTLFRAFEELTNERSNLRLVVVGGGSAEDEARVRSQAHHLGDRVSFTGSRDDVDSFFNAADVLVVSSKGEGSSNVINEAMLCGCPCVSTDTGTARELLGDSVVPVGDHRALAAAIRRVLDAPRPTYLIPVVPFTDLDLARETLEALGLDNGNA